ncbi:hypothetical protein ACFLVB_04070 [Chloroflexota bacterium]
MEFEENKCVTCAYFCTAQNDIPVITIDERIHIMMQSPANTPTGFIGEFDCRGATCYFNYFPGYRIDTDIMEEFHNRITKIDCPEEQWKEYCEGVSPELAEQQESNSLPVKWVTRAFGWIIISFIFIFIYFIVSFFILD